MTALSNRQIEKKAFMREALMIMLAHGKLNSTAKGYAGFASDLYEYMIREVENVQRK